MRVYEIMSLLSELPANAEILVDIEGVDNLLEIVNLSAVNGATVLIVESIND